MHPIRKLIPVFLLLFSFFNGLANNGGIKSVNQVFERKPLLFIENKGQVTDQNDKLRTDIDFKINTPNIDIYIGNGAIHYQWSKSVVKENTPAKKQRSIASFQNIETETYRLDVVLLGANINAKVVAEEMQPYFESYYLAQCPQGLTAASFKQVRYKDVYPGIDWVLYTQIVSGKEVLKYDFIVHPGGNPADIKIRYEGATALALNDGNLTVSTPMGAVTEDKPYTYNKETKTEIPSQFVLNNNVLSFDVLKEENSTIVIDPSLHWATYAGFSTTDYGLAVSADAVGNSYVGGWTLGTNNASFGLHQFAYAGAQDGFIAKFNAGGQVEWMTYYGGNGYDEVTDMVNDAAGNLYLTGNTTSASGMATTGAHQSSHGGSLAGYSGLDAFVAKFTPTGHRIWATYYGDSVNDNSYAIDCDRDGNVFIAGHTDSRRFIASAGAFKTTYSGGFLAKFNAAGTRQWGTYCIDTGWNYIADIACDIKGNVYCVGTTPAYLNIATSGSHQPVNGGQVGGSKIEDGFLMKFNGAGQLQWSTYYGGYFDDYIKAVTCDDRGHVYIAGTTISENGTCIATSGVHQPAYFAARCTLPNPFGPGFILDPLRRDAFLAKFSEDGTRMWGTYYGTSWSDEISAINVLPNGNIYLAGRRDIDSPCQLPPPTVNVPLAKPYTYLARFNRFGHNTWYIENSVDTRYDDMAYNDGKLYVCNTTYEDNKSTISPNPPHLFGASDAFVWRYFVDTAVFVPMPFRDTLVCIGDTLTVPYDVTNKFNSGNTITLQLSDASGSFANATTLTAVTSDTGGVIKYQITNAIPPGGSYRFRLIGSNPVDTSLDNNVNIRIAEYPNVGPVAIFPICANGTLQLMDTGTSPATTQYEWTGPGGFSVGTQTYNRPNVQVTDSGYYVMKGDNYGCVNIDSVHVTVYAKPAKPTYTTNSPVCEGDTLKTSVSTSTVGVTKFNWAMFQDTITAPIWYRAEAETDTVIPSAALSDSGRYVIVSLAGGCPSDPAVIKIIVNPVVAPTVQIGSNLGTNVGPWVDVTFSVTGNSNAGTNPAYQWIKNGVDIPGATGASYTATSGVGVQSGDTICVRMTSYALCAKPDVAVSCLGLTVDLGINDKNRSAGLQLYPNPNTGKFILQSDMPFTHEEVSVMNAVGQLVYKGFTPDGSKKCEIDLSNPPSGIYYLRTYNNGNSISLRFVIEK